jgi:hypothetical protein
VELHGVVPTLSKPASCPGPMLESNKGLLILAAKWPGALAPGADLAPTGDQKPGGAEQVARPQGPSHPWSTPSDRLSGADSHSGLSPHVPTRVCPHPAKPRAPTRVLGLAQGSMGQPRPQARSGPHMTRPSWVTKTPGRNPTVGSDQGVGP